VGDRLTDHCTGEVVRVVAKDDEGWPLMEGPRRPGPNPGIIPILCGDLVKAVCEESIGSVAKHWGVKPGLVRKWRKAIAGQDKCVSTALTLLAYDPSFRKKTFL
jgi:hypothetical protein